MSTTKPRTMDRFRRPDGSFPPIAGADPTAVVDQRPSQTVVAKAEREIAEAETRVKEAEQAVVAARDALGTKEGALLDQNSPEFKAMHEAVRARQEAEQARAKAHEAFGTLQEGFLDKFTPSGSPRAKGENGDPAGKALPNPNEVDFDKFHADVKELLEQNAEFKDAAEWYAKHDKGSLYTGQKNWGYLGTKAELKALLVGTSLAAAKKPAKRLPMIDASPLVDIGILDLITVAATDNPAQEYPAYLGLDGTAGMVAEPTDPDPANAPLKPTVQLTFEMRSAAAKTIAATLDTHRWTLKDVERFTQMIEEKLPEAVIRKAAQQVLAGTGTGDDLRGILNQSGIGVQAKGLDSTIDAIFKAQTLVTIAGFDPTAVAMNPLLWQSIRLAKDSTGNYLFGPPNMPGPKVAFGVPIITNTSIPLATPITGKFDELELLIEDALSFLTTDSHADNFKRNIITCLAEMRALILLQFPAALAKVTGAS